MTELREELYLVDNDIDYDDDAPEVEINTKLSESLFNDDEDFDDEVFMIKEEPKEHKKVEKDVNESFPKYYVYSVGTNLDDVDLLKQDIDALDDYNLHLVGVSDNGDFTGELFFEGKIKDIRDYLDTYVGGIQIVNDYLVPKEEFESTISAEYLKNHPFNLNKADEEGQEIDSDLNDIDEELIVYDNGIGFSFPEVKDTLAVYCQWEGIIGYDDDIIDYLDTTEEDLDSYLSDEGIYGYTEALWKILNSNEAYCSDMDLNDFENVCADLFLDPDEARLFENDSDDLYEKVEIIPNHEDSLKMLNHDLGAITEEVFNIGSNKNIDIDSVPYKRIEEVCDKLNSMELIDKWHHNPVHFEVKETYEDYGANMLWKTIICYEDNGDSHQILNPKEWLDIANGDISSDEAIDGIMADKYCQFIKGEPAVKEGALKESVVDPYYELEYTFGKDHYDGEEFTYKVDKFDAVEYLLKDNDLDYLADKLGCEEDEDIVAEKLADHLDLFERDLTDHFSDDAYDAWKDRSGFDESLKEDVSVGQSYYLKFDSKEEADKAEEIVKSKGLLPDRMSDKLMKVIGNEAGDDATKAILDELGLAYELHEDKMSEGSLESTPGFMSPEEIRDFDRANKEKAKAEKDALKAKRDKEKKADIQAVRIAARKKELAREVESKSYYVLADILNDVAGATEDGHDAYDLSEDEVLQTLRSIMSDEEILKKYHELFESLDENTSEEKAIWEVDLVEFKDNDLEDYDVVDTVRVTYSDLNNKFNGLATKNIRTKEVADNILLNGDIGQAIESVARDKANIKDRKTDIGFGFDNLKVIENHLPSGVEKLRKEIGRKLLPNRLSEKIVKIGNKYQVQSEKGRNMGTYDTKKEAEERLKQIEMFKHMNKD